MESSSQDFLSDYFSDTARSGSHHTEPNSTPPYFTYQSGQPLDTVFAVDHAFQPMLCTPIKPVPQSNVRTQQQLREPMQQTLGRSKKRRKVDHHDDSTSVTSQAQQFNANQLPFHGFGPEVPGVVSEPTFSQCCSSCSDGPLCDEPGCEDQREKVVPCMETDCEAPVCTDKCMYPAAQALDLNSGQLGFASITKVPNWNESLWDRLRTSTTNPADSNANVELAQCELRDFPDVSSIPLPLRYDDSKLYCNPLLPPQRQRDETRVFVDSSGVLNGTGELFSGAQPSQFPRQCEWSSCGQPMQNPEECLQHLHEMHFDPQMIFNCPIEMPSCQESIANPLDHLTAKHGWTIPTYDEDDFRKCPAPSCSGFEAYMDPQQLHHHFDEVHSTPVEGGLHCKWSSCSTVVDDPHALFAHLSEEHQLPVPVTGIEDIDLTQAASSSPQQQASHLSCRWTLRTGQVCGEICASEIELHEHVKSNHLQSLEKNGGYFCCWEDCRRNSKLGDKRGFSQKGKLERHMASHTGYKCCKCDWVNPDGTICNATFSAPQAYNQHRLLHTGERPWPCKYCGKTFPQQSAKTIHERTHTKEKPLKCEFCDMRFSESSNLAKHRKTHGEKGKYACKEPGCTKTYHRLDQLKQHTTSHRKGMRESPQVSSSDVPSPSQDMLESP